jgi:hypothetical protein
MNDEDYLFTIRDGKSRSRYWLAGMDWAPKERQKFRLPSFQLKNHVRKNSGVRRPHLKWTINGRDKGNSRREWQIARPSSPSPAFSLALAFCASTRNGYGIYRLNSTDFVFLASINGLPAVTADKTGRRTKCKRC